MSLQFILPLLSAIVYVAGALLLKRAAELGVDTWRMVWVCNLVTALTFAPLLLLGGTIPAAREFWKPALVALLFLAGQTLAFRSLQVGDVSVATPVLGLKIILVAFFTTLVLGERLPITLWAAALLSSIAIGLLQARRAGSHHHVGATVVLAGMAAATFALFDVLVQKWAPVWGMGRFLPVMMFCVALYSLGMPWLWRRQSQPFPKPSTRWLAGGALCLGVQSVTFVSGIALFGHATVANVFYSSRGLWSVVAVWLVGHWFKNREQALGAGILVWRLCGAILLLGAVVLALW